MQNENEALMIKLIGAQRTKHVNSFWFYFMKLSIGSPLRMYDNEVMNTTMNDSPRQIMVSLEKRPKLSGLNMVWKKLEC
jgi:hypothetical protein